MEPVRSKENRLCSCHTYTWLIIAPVVIAIHDLGMDFRERSCDSDAESNFGGKIWWSCKISRMTNIKYLLNHIFLNFFMILLTYLYFVLFFVYLFNKEFFTGHIRTDHVDHLCWRVITYDSSFHIRRYQLQQNSCRKSAKIFACCATW